VIYVFGPLTELNVVSGLSSSLGLCVCLDRLLTDSDEIGAMEQNQAKETKEWWYDPLHSQSD
jgi:hypothetical protein